MSKENNEEKQTGSAAQQGELARAELVAAVEKPLNEQLNAMEVAQESKSEPKLAEQLSGEQVVTALSAAVKIDINNAADEKSPEKDVLSNARDIIIKTTENAYDAMPKPGLRSFLIALHTSLLEEDPGYAAAPDKFDYITRCAPQVASKIRKLYKANSNYGVELSQEVASKLFPNAPVEQKEKSKDGRIKRLYPITKLPDKGPDIDTPEWEAEQARLVAEGEAIRVRGRGGALPSTRNKEPNRPATPDDIKSPAIELVDIKAQDKEKPIAAVSADSKKTSEIPPPIIPRDRHVRHNQRELFLNPWEASVEAGRLLKQGYADSLRNDQYAEGSLLQKDLDYCHRQFRSMDGANLAPRKERGSERHNAYLAEQRNELINLMNAVQSMADAAYDGARAGQPIPDALHRDLFAALDSAERRLKHIPQDNTATKQDEMSVWKSDMQTSIHSARASMLNALDAHVDYRTDHWDIRRGVMGEIATAEARLARLAVAQNDPDLAKAPPTLPATTPKWYARAASAIGRGLNGLANGVYFVGSITEPLRQVRLFTQGLADRATKYRERMDKQQALNPRSIGAALGQLGAFMLTLAAYTLHAIPWASQVFTESGRWYEQAKSNWNHPEKSRLVWGPLIVVAYVWHNAIELVKLPARGLYSLISIVASPFQAWSATQQLVSPPVAKAAASMTEQDFAKDYDKQRGIQRRDLGLSVAPEPQLEAVVRQTAQPTAAKAAFDARLQAVNSAFDDRRLFEKYKDASGETFMRAAGDVDPSTVEQYVKQDLREWSDSGELQYHATVIEQAARHAQTPENKFQKDAVNIQVAHLGHLIKMLDVLSFHLQSSKVWHDVNQQQRFVQLLTDIVTKADKVVFDLRKSGYTIDTNTAERLKKYEQSAFSYLPEVPRIVREITRLRDDGENPLDRHQRVMFVLERAQQLLDRRDDTNKTNPDPAEMLEMRYLLTSQRQQHYDDLLGAEKYFEKTNQLPWLLSALYETDPTRFKSEANDQNSELSKLVDMQARRELPPDEKSLDRPAVLEAAKELLPSLRKERIYVRTKEDQELEEKSSSSL